MVKSILENAGFVFGKTYKETRFISPPKSTSYAVYTDSFDRGGGDNEALLMRHNVTIELYEYALDPETEAKLEAQFDEYLPYMSGDWTKQERYWIETENMYQVIYEFDYIQK